MDGRYSRVTYDLIGDDNAPVLFNINPTSGAITISSAGLLSDSSSLYQVGGLVFCIRFYKPVSKVLFFNVVGDTICLLGCFYDLKRC